MHGARRVAVILFCAAALIAVGSTSMPALEERAYSTAPVASGWHPWYELKVDPENASNMIACGSRWDAGANALFGFVYASADSGKTWRKALEDKHTTWVSEQSCAFGRKHTAYFISEASKVIDGQPQHHLGRTRLYVSTDAGQHWLESMQTGWADYSSSAVSARTGDIYTFFNYGDLLDQDKGRGTAVGLLVFSPERKTVSGPFVPSAMTELSYHGTYPSNAVALRDGSVVTLYMALRTTPDGPETILGSERASPSTSPSFTVIASSGGQTKKSCLGLEDYSVAHDENDDRLVVIYRELKDNGCRVMLSVSDDGGRTWSKGAQLVGIGGEELTVARPSLAAGSNGTLGLLWSRDRKWFFSTVRGTTLTGRPRELHAGRDTTGIVPGSLMSVFYQTSGYQADASALPSSPRLNVRSSPAWIWRSVGLAAAGNGFVAVFASTDGDLANLYAARIALKFSEGGGPSHDQEGRGASEFDASSVVSLVYGGAQSFDNTTGTLSVEVRLANRGSKPLLAPIRLEATEISSKVGEVKVLNADNGLTGKGAVWDLSRLIAGDWIPAGATTYPSFSLLFHITPDHAGMVASRDVLNLSARVWAASATDCAAQERSGASAETECPGEAATRPPRTR